MLLMPNFSPASVTVSRDSIQVAVDSAEPGDTIEISPEVYHETIQVGKNNIIIQGSTAVACYLGISRQMLQIKLSQFGIR